MFDRIFRPPNDGDAAFHAALDRYRDKVVLGANFDFSLVREQGGAAQNVPPNSTLIPPQQMDDDRVGYVVFFPDSLDKRIRSVRYTITDLQLAGQFLLPGEKPYESLGARALGTLGRGADVTRDLRERLVRFRAVHGLQHRALSEVLG